MNVVRIDDTEKEFFDSLCLEINTVNNETISIRVVYKPPKQSEESNDMSYKEIGNTVRQRNSFVVEDCDNSSL